MGRVVERDDLRKGFLGVPKYKIFVLNKKIIENLKNEFSLHSQRVVLYKRPARFRHKEEVSIGRHRSDSPFP